MSTYNVAQMSQQRIKAMIQRDTQKLRKLLEMMPEVPYAQATAAQKKLLADFDRVLFHRSILRIGRGWL